MNSSYISTHDKSGRMLEASKSVETITLYRREELYGMDNIYKLIYPEDAGRVYSKSHIKTTNDVPKVYWRMIRKDGSIIHVLTYSTQINDKIIATTIKLGKFHSFILNTYYCLDRFLSKYIKPNFIFLKKTILF